MAAAPAAKTETVMILLHEIDTTRGRADLTHLRVPKSWTDEDKLVAGGTCFHSCGYSGSNIGESCVLRRLYATALDGERLTAKDKEELRKAVPGFPEQWERNKYQSEAQCELKETDWHLHRLHCIYRVESN